MNYHDGRGPRCLCGHYESEHDRPGPGAGKRCIGAYATLMADADDFESVEVRCPCDHFSVVKSDYHLIRT